MMLITSDDKDGFEAMKARLLRDKMEIPFTQYVLPDGRSERTFFECEDKDTYDKAQELLDEDCYFDIEVLTTGAVSMTCERVFEGDPETLSIEISSNGVEIVDKVRDLVNNAHKFVFNL